MKVLFDTSVLIAAMIEAHPAHEKALPWLKQAKQKKITSFLSSHTLAELYAVLTRLPIKPIISPTTALQLIKENITPNFEIISLSNTDYLSILEYLSKNKIVGGVIYDVLILHIAVKENIDQIITLNGKDFRRIYPALSGKIIVP